MKWKDRRDLLVISTEYDGTLVEEINIKGKPNYKTESYTSIQQVYGRHRSLRSNI